MGLTEGAAKIFEQIRRRKIDYKLACSQPAMQRMLIDLADFCRAGETCAALDGNGKIDVERTLILEGRREVWLRMMNHCNLSTTKLYALMTGHEFNPGDTDD